MKVIKFNCGTRKEILDHFASKLSGKCTYPPHDAPIGSLWELSHKTVEHMVDTATSNLFPIVIIEYVEVYYDDKLKSKWHRFKNESFYISDYHKCYMDNIIKEIDNDELRNKKLDSLRLLLKMEENSKELYDKIVVAMNEFNGKTLKFSDV